MSKRACNEDGFTLVELLLVLSITAILVAIVVPNLAGITGGMRLEAAAKELDIVQSAFDTLMIEMGAITVSAHLTVDGISLAHSTAITCYKHDGAVVNIPTSDYSLRLRTASTGKYTWDSGGLIKQTSY